MHTEEDKFIFKEFYQLGSSWHCRENKIDILEEI